MANTTQSPWAQVVDQPPAPPLANLPVQEVASQPVPNAIPKLAPQPLTPQQQQIATTNAELRKVEMAKARPWGFEGAPPSAEFPEGLAPNHPGKLGKLAHVFGTLGNIAGDIFAPAVMQNIPGTQMNMQAKEGMLANRLNTETGEEATNEHLGAESKQANAQAGYLGAETGKTQEETTEMPGKTASEIALQNAQAYRAIHPLATSNFELWHQQNPDGTAQQYEQMMQKPLSMQQAGDLNAVWDKIAAKNGLPTGQFKNGMPAADANALSASLNNVISRNQGAQGITIKQEQLSEKVPMLAPDGNGGFKLQYIQPGQTVTPGSMTPTQEGSTNVPTAATRTMAETAPKVIDLANRSEQLIDQQINALGPMASRWNEFMAGKVGAPNPEFTKLRTNIGLLQTALMRMHVGARGGEQIMQHFANLIDVSKQDPQNLKAALDEIKSYADEVGKSGTGNSAAETTKAEGGGKTEPKVQQNSKGEYRYSTDGGKTWQAGKPNQ